MYTLLTKNSKGLYVRHWKEWNSPDHPELKQLERSMPKWREQLIIAVMDLENALHLLNYGAVAKLAAAAGE